jgi:hypothetical protein
MPIMRKMPRIRDYSREEIHDSPGIMGVRCRATDYSSREVLKNEAFRAVFAPKKVASDLEKLPPFCVATTGEY